MLLKMLIHSITFILGLSISIGIDLRSTKLAVYLKRTKTVAIFLNFQFQVQMAQGGHHLGLDEEERSVV